MNLAPTFTATPFLDRPWKGYDDYTRFEWPDPDHRCSRCGRPYSEHGADMRYFHTFRSQPVRLADWYTGELRTTFLWPDGHE